MGDPHPIATLCAAMMLVGSIAICSGKWWGYILLVLVFLICCATSSTVWR